MTNCQTIIEANSGVSVCDVQTAIDRIISIDPRLRAALPVIAELHIGNNVPELTKNINTGSDYLKPHTGVVPEGFGKVGGACALLNRNGNIRSAVCLRSDVIQDAAYGSHASESMGKVAHEFWHAKDYHDMYSSFDDYVRTSTRREKTNWVCLDFAVTMRSEYFAERRAAVFYSGFNENLEEFDKVSQALKKCEVMLRKWDSLSLDNPDVRNIYSELGVHLHNCMNMYAYGLGYLAGRSDGFLPRFRVQPEMQISSSMHEFSRKTFIAASGKLSKIFESKQSTVKISPYGGLPEIIEGISSRVGFEFVKGKKDIRFIRSRHVASLAPPSREYGFQGSPILKFQMLGDDPDRSGGYHP